MFWADTYAPHCNQDICIALPIMPEKNPRNTSLQNHVPTASCICIVDNLPASATDIFSQNQKASLHLQQNVVSIKCWGDNQEWVLAKEFSWLSLFLLGYLIMNQDFFYTKDCEKKIGF